jgi:3',5'-cyclic AMP phosphodiesterase CpdA
MLKLVILSDLHIVPEGSVSQTLDTYERLERGIAHLNAVHGDADLCILAGDLADLGEAEAYLRLRTLLAGAAMPVEITIGNHDDRDTFIEVFGQEHLSETGHVDKVVDLKGYRIVLLDSAVTGEHGGRLEQSQLDWLTARLEEAADRPVIVVLHHHANPLSTRVDRIILENGDRFAEVLKGHPDIRQVIAGHVHYPSTAIWRGLPFTTLAGGHYSVNAVLDPERDVTRLAGPAQMAVVLGDAEQTLVHFDDYINGHAVLA